MLDITSTNVTDDRKKICMHACNVSPFPSRVMICSILIKTCFPHLRLAAGHPKFTGHPQVWGVS